MSNSEFFTPPKPGKRAGVIVLIVVAALVFVAGIALSDDDENTANPDSGASSTSSGADGRNSLTILTGESDKNGVGVGYPHTMQGAVSAAVEFTSQVLSTLDAKRAEDVAAVANDPEAGYDPADVAANIAAIREDMGLPATGEVPDGASMVTAPVAYQLRDETDDQMMVLLLCYVTKNNGTDEPTEETAVYNMPMAWNGDDWKSVRSNDDTDYTDLIAKPGSDDAREKGWKEITR